MEQENEIWAFWAGWQYRKKKIEPIKSNFEGGFFHVFMDKNKFFFSNALASALKNCKKLVRKPPQNTLKFNYHTGVIITSRLCTFYPLFEIKKSFFKELFS